MDPSFLVGRGIVGWKAGVGLGRGGGRGRIIVYRRKSKRFPSSVARFARQDNDSPREGAKKKSEPPRRHELRTVEPPLLLAFPHVLAPPRSECVLGGSDIPHVGVRA